MVELLLDLGLTADDVRSVNYEALRNACDLKPRISPDMYLHGSDGIACALAARLGGESELPPDLQAATLKLVIRKTIYKFASTAARRAEARLAAARAAAAWPGHEEALASLGAEDKAAWEELYAEATLAGVGALRFAD